MLAGQAVDTSERSWGLSSIAAQSRLFQLYYFLRVLASKTLHSANARVPPAPHMPRRARFPCIGRTRTPCPYRPAIFLSFWDVLGNRIDPSHHIVTAGTCSPLSVTVHFTFNRGRGDDNLRLSVIQNKFSQTGPPFDLRIADVRKRCRAEVPRPTRKTFQLD